MTAKSEKYFCRITHYPDLLMETFHSVDQVPFHSFTAKTYYISNFKDFNTITPNLL
ncbi:hypothetical protein [Dyadobacter frigoris]|uniref:hypothetical protein n=1 Tax=Dyadobacter frigoris TaxID=2576211 RepID=UPI0014851B1A|nr:hypothetical protein [Dyadobacter frigoris]